MKETISLILAIIMLVSIIPSVSASSSASVNASVEVKVCTMGIGTDVDHINFGEMFENDISAKEPVTIMVTGTTWNRCHGSVDITVTPGTWVGANNTMPSSQTSVTPRKSLSGVQIGDSRIVDFQLTIPAGQPADIYKEMIVISAVY